jgi:hypothetical protein
MKYFALLGALLFTLVACGSKSDHGGYIDDGASGKLGIAGHTGSSAGSSGMGGDSGASTGGDAGEGGEAGATGNNLLAPIVEITAPTALSDPNNGDVVTGSSVMVTCSVTESTAAGSQPVLISSIKIQMFGADGKQIGKDGAVMSTANAGEYGASFVLTNVPSGVVSFRCSASDSSPSANSAKATVATYYDAGPVIAVTDPADKSAHPLGGIQFKFSALPNALVTDDEGAAVSVVTLKVDGLDITDFTPVANKPGFYQASIDLNNPIKFPQTPVGVISVVITAKNKRGTTATSNTTFIVDSTGPLVTILSPSTSGVQFVTGQVVLVFKVVDEMGGSGVDPSTVTVKVNNTPPVAYKEGNSWHSADGITFTYAFSVQNVSVNTQVAVIIDAKDNAGNKALGTAASYYVDTQAPVIDLDPPNLQELDRTTKRCGEPFDPLGDDSPSDGDTIPQNAIFRALLWDLGNFVDSTDGIEFFSDIDTTAGVRIYFQEDASKPLLKSDTPNGTCNQIADLTLPFSNLVPIAPMGASYYDAAAPTPSICVHGSDTQAPKRLCGENSRLTRVIQHEVATATAVSAIYGLQGGDGSLCTGNQADLTSKISKDGWVCAAVAAQDKMGNTAVSAPIRFCLDATGYPGSPPCAGQAPPPELTCVPLAPNSCTPPARFTRTLILKP